MNRKQTIILLCGMLIATFFIMFPPWITTTHFDLSNHGYGPQAKWDLVEPQGHNFIFTPPESQELLDIKAETKINWKKLVLPVGCTLGLTMLMVVVNKSSN